MATALSPQTPIAPGQSPRSWVRTWWGKVTLGFLFLMVLAATLFILALVDSAQNLPSGSVLGSDAFTRLASVPAATGDGDADLFTEENPTLGKETAQLTIVAFEDFACPFCGAAFPTIRTVMLEHQQDVQFIFRHFPIDELHPDARLAAEASMCAKDQAKFWQYHDRLFLNQDRLAREHLFEYAVSSGLDMDLFTACLDNRDHADTVSKDYEDGIRLGVVGTPTFFFNGHRVEGALPKEGFDEIINAFLTP